MHKRSIWAPGKRLIRAFRCGAVLAVLAVLIGNSALPAVAGPALYPDIVTMAPSGIYIERASNGHYLLRFANTAANVGGRLEISVDYIGSKVIYQNVYDQKVGGNRVVRQQVHSDLIYHPQHNHFHFAGFAQYELLKKNSAGAFNVTARAGSKTTFCILDTVRVNSTGPTYPTYTSCGAKQQGMSSGWGDTYVAALYDQWIDVGTMNLTDGQYAIRSTADPDNRIFETNDFNNVGMTYFSVANGRVVSIVNPATCTAAAAAGGTGAVNDPDQVTVGSVVRLECARFQAGEPVDIYWGSVNTTAKTTTTATSSGTLSTFVETPASSLGVHFWIAKGRTSGIQAAAIVNTVPTVKLEPNRGEVATETTATLRGFSAGEQIEVRFYKSGKVIALTTTATASGSGSASVEFDVPVGPFGAHTVEAVGKDSGAIATTTFVTTPSIDLDVDEADSGDKVGVSLRGFIPGETVSIKFGQDKLEVARFTPSHSGSTSSSSSEFTVPDVESGDHTVTAQGSISGLIASTTLDVDGPGPSEDPTSTPTATDAPSETATAVETETSVPEPTSTETPANGSPIAVAGDDQSIVDTDGSGTETVQLTGSGSSDPDGDSLSATWSIDNQVVSTDLDTTIDLPVGAHTLTLSVDDGRGGLATDDLVITILLPELQTETPPP